MKISILGVNIDSLSWSEVLARVQSFLVSPGRYTIVTPNPEFIVLAQRDEKFKHVLNSASLAVPDGVGLVLASYLLGNRINRRIAGVDLVEKICQLAAYNNKSIYFLGGQAGVGEKAATVLQQKFPKLKIAGVNSNLIIPAQGQAADYQNQAVIDRVNQAQPDILLVALGQGKQEKWIYHNLSKLPSVKIAMGVGGSLDFISGIVKRAPVLWRRLGLEWLWRLFTQPWRLGRIWRATVYFSYLVIRFRFQQPWRRRNVCGFIYNNEGKVFVAERVGSQDHWQLPQGGVDKGETPQQAIIRELAEELGTDKFEIKRRCHLTVCYNFSDAKLFSSVYGPYPGQKQSIFILKFVGENVDFHLDKDVFTAWQWVAPEQLLDKLHYYRRPVADIALTELRELNKSL
ncbi:MAG: WecB/TagA/CpsF family glycosyltransferase [Patescibacteria group bacterium]